MQPINRTIRRAIPMLLAAAMLAGTAMTLAACNTTAGAGQDVSAVGNAVSTSAQKVKSGL